MAFFSKAEDSRLFLSQPGPDDTGTVAAILPNAHDCGAICYDIAQILNDTELSASILFLQQRPPSDAAGQQALVDAILAFNARHDEQRMMIWAPSASSCTSPEFSPPYTALLRDGEAKMYIGHTLVANIGRTLSVTLSHGAKLSALSQEAGLDIDTSRAPITFNQTSGVKPSSDILSAAIPFSGAHCGCLRFTVYLPFSSLASLNMGFAFGAPQVEPTSSQDIVWSPILLAPLAVNSGNRGSVSFTATVDLLDPFNEIKPERTALAFDGTTLAFDGTNRRSSTTVLTSTYVTTSGADTVLLTPVSIPGQGKTARLVFHYPSSIGIDDPIYLHVAPEGDFILSLSSGAASAELMCGLQGTEYLLVNAGDRLRFTSGQPAFAPDFPFGLSSPTAAPPASEAPLTSAWETSYASVWPAGKLAVAVAQPPGLNLFGNDTLIHDHYNTLLGPMDPGQSLAAAPQQCFPLVPYSEVHNGDGKPTFTAAQVATFEAQVLAPRRRQALTADSVGSHLSAAERLAAVPSDDHGTVTFTTPNGFLVTAAGSGSTASWQQILLGILRKTGPDQTDQRLAFNNPSQPLIDAFQSGSLMLVCANGENLGGSAFENELTLSGWKLKANVGVGSQYGSYANIMIIKAMKGPLYDPTGPASANLVGNPAKWTMASEFAAPVTTTPGHNTPSDRDPAQMTNLALWLRDYFAEAEAEAEAHPDTHYYDSFNTIAKDPNWTGLLVLRGDIRGFPKEFNGLLKEVPPDEVPDRNAPYFHHLAIPITPIKNGSAGPVPVEDQASAISGLIHYLDPQVDPTNNPPNPLPKSAGSGAYDFRLLQLKVLFEGGAIKLFSCFAQISFDELLGMTVKGMDNRGKKDNGSNRVNAIVLTGSCQYDENKNPIYSMSSVSDTVFRMGNATQPSIRVSGVQMVHLGDTSSMRSMFVLSGSLHFAVLQGATPSETFDLFSFSEPAKTSRPTGPTGLAFNSLVLNMDSSAQPKFTLDAQAIRFDLDASKVREGSLADQLALQLTDFVIGASGTLQDAGYLPIVANMIRPGDLGDKWNGLVFRLNLGTLGQLGNGVGFNGSLLLAWSLQDGPAAVQVGLSLSGAATGGAKLITLQNILKLSIGRIRLSYDTIHSSYLLLLDEIALQFLGLKIPPNGATSFYLFGNHDPAGVGWYARYAQELPTLTTPQPTER